MKINGIEVFISDDGKERVVIRHPHFIPKNKADSIVRYLMDEGFLTKERVKVTLIRTNLV